MTMSPEHLSDVDYDSRARATLASVEATVDRLLQDDVIDIDASRTGGLLELRFPGRRHDRRQHPAAAAGALAGGAVGRLSLQASGGRWIDGRDGGEFFAVLSACASELGGKALRFEP